MKLSDGEARVELRLRGTGVCRLLGLLLLLTLTGCQSSTVYFGQFPYGIYEVPAKGGTPKNLGPMLAQIMGLACTADGRRLYAAHQSAIDQWGTDGSSLGVLIPTGIADCVALDEKAGRVYWGDQGKSEIASCDLKGGDKRVLVSHVNFPEAVAVNPERGLIYWVQGGPDAGVWMSRVDGSSRRMIGQLVGVPPGLAVDVPSGRLFWSQPKLFNMPSTITKATLDGSHAKMIIKEAGASIRGVAVDPLQQRIVWIERRIDGKPARICRAKFDGSSVETVCEFSGAEFARSVTVGRGRG